MKIIEILKEDKATTPVVWYHGSKVAYPALMVGKDGEDVYGKGIYATTNINRARSYGEVVREVIIEPSVNTINATDILSESDFGKICNVLREKITIRGNYSATFGTKSDHFTTITIGDPFAKVHKVLRNCFGTKNVNAILHTALECDVFIVPESNKHLTAVTFTADHIKLK